MSQFKSLNLGVLVLDERLQSRVQISEDTVSEYADSMEEGDKFPPVLVYFDSVHYYLTDGYHRYFAAKRAGKASIECEVMHGAIRDAILHSTAVNSKHGMRRTYADKRKAVMTLLDDFEWSQWSSSEIARQCGVSISFVSNLKNSSGKQSETVKYKTPLGDVKEKKKAEGRQPELKGPEVAPVDEDQHRQEAIDMLLTENEQLKDRLAVEAMDASEEEKTLAKQTIDELREELRILKIELTAVKASRDMFQAENSQLKSQVKMLNNKLKKAGVE